MRIIILGYTGLIGNNVLEYLVKNTSFHLICVGKDIKSKPFKNKKIKYYKWNFNSFKKQDLFFLKKANIIINCVGKASNNKNKLENINVNFVKRLLKYINIYKYRIRLVHLSSISVYGGGKNYFGQNKIVSENSALKIHDYYSKSKLEADVTIQNYVKKKLNKSISYTILRISNVFGGRKKSNLYKYVRFSLKLGFWIKCYDDIVFNFINVKDVSRAVFLVISNLKISKNKTYIVSDDCKQYHLYERYKILYKKKIIKAFFPITLVKFIFYFLPLSEKIINFILVISSRVSYSNEKIKKELNFKPRFSILKNIKFLNE